ncbi:TPA: hypothetical protein ACOEAZ_004383 [Enterobacter asburiae]
MKKIAALLLIAVFASPAAIAKKPGGNSGWQSGNSGHQLGCLIISLLGMQGCEKPRDSKLKE